MENASRLVMRFFHNNWMVGCSGSKINENETLIGNLKAMKIWMNMEINYLVYILVVHIMKGSVASLMVSALDPRPSGLSLSPGQVSALCHGLDTLLSYCLPPPSVYYKLWVLF